MGPRMRRYIENTWKEQIFVLKQRNFFSEPLEVEKGVTQGDIDSPIIFNLIIDAVLRKIQSEETYGKSDLSFYADNGLLEGGCKTASKRPG